ncbi:MAG: DinB family protein [Gemmatimonadetes bacterium]|nr:DinB family protein [Gemmatimonadota bacterium]
MSVYGGKELAAAFRTVRGNTIKIATEIPAERYGFSAVEGARTIGQLLAHIAYGHKIADELHRVRHVSTLVGFDFPGLIGRVAADEAKLTTKEQILGVLEKEGEAFATWLASLSDASLAERVENYDKSGSRSRFEMLLSPKEHEMHHRGQLMLLERLVGIVPHLTRERMARAATATR